MANQQLEKYIAVVLTVIAALLIITWLRHTQDFMVPFLLAIFIAVIASSPVNWLKNKNVPLPLAILLVLFIFIAMLVAISLLLGTSLNQFATQLPIYKAQLKELFEGVVSWLASYDINVSKSGLMNAIEPGAVMQFMEGLIGSVANVFSKSVLILLTVLFMLLDGWKIADKIERHYGARSAPVMQALNKAALNTRKYMAIKTIMNFLMAVIVGICLAIIGLEYTVLWAVLLFLLNFIPSIGLFIAAAPAVLFSLIQLGSMPTLIVIMVYLVVNAIFDMLIQPRYLGSKMGLPIVVIFLSVFFWGWVLGPFGMILAIPLTMLFKQAFEAYQETQST